MHRIFSIIFFLVSFPLLKGQEGVFEDQTWNFGEVAFWKNDTAWFKVRNGTSRNLIFLPTYYNENFTIMFSNRAAEPGETIRIGIVYYTQKKGKFDVSVPLYVNQKPDAIMFRLKGNIRGFDPAAQLRCPVVNEGPAPEHLEKIVTLEVRDRQTDELLQPDRIIVKDRQEKKVALERAGLEFEMSVMPGTFKVDVGKKGYDDYYALISIEPYQNRFVVYMDRSNPDPIPEPVKPVVTINTDSLLEVESRKNRDVVNTGDSNATAIRVENHETHVHPDTLKPVTAEIKKELDRASYKLNNVILIVDVSSSMNRNGKLDILRSSFGIVVDALRAEDRVGVITMAGMAEVVQAPGPLVDKDSLKRKVDRIKAVGATNAGAALQLAYKLAADNKIEGGNNQIIIATDGIFYGGSLSRQQMEKLIAAGNEDGIHLSTVGIGNDPKALDFLHHLSSIGGGSSVQLNSDGGNDAVLLEMIKDQSRITR